MPRRMRPSRLEGRRRPIGRSLRGHARVDEWPVRRPRSWSAITADDEVAFDLRCDLDLYGDYDAGDDDGLHCSWCGRVVDDEELDDTVSLDIRTSQYWGPLRFDDGFDEALLAPSGLGDDLRVAVFLDGEWRWLSLTRTRRRNERYAFNARMCSSRCERLLSIALGRENALRRAH